ncbi:Erythronate-4-phosphate dehydrogenase [Gossypium arboreum]|uniref:Erythronate-4-phosphate dehydrogenase n=1 Tax=Gossypium arboreum TaxID=29729 RepID=A0A0B0P792_GOSAR|nr:Erythronate-4-phosphate dehydrogenase [Gossypium arboreum]KHG28890.1 Erythronate-4-phosphate dehydrogenase [Gossypium arboreum]
MLHSRVSPRGPYNLWPKSDSTTIEAHGPVLWLYEQVSMYALF